MSGRLVHFELPVDDVERARAFYAEAFGWSVVPMAEMDYTMVSTGPTGDQGPTEAGYIGGGMLRRSPNHEHPVLTIDVDDIDATLADVERLGGATVTPRQPVGEMGYTAYFTDPEGNVTGLWETAPQGS